MTQKLQNYFTTFFVFVIVFVLFHFSPIIDTITSFAFIISTLLFIFTLEEKPKKASDYKTPEVHFYQSERINLYGIIMVCGASAAAFLFYFASTNSSIRIGIVSLFLWIVLIVISYSASMHVSKNFYADTITNYIILVTNYKKDQNILNKSVKELLETGSSEKKKLLKSFKTNYFTETEKNRIIKHFLEYKERTDNGNVEITSEEIEEINK